MDIEKERNIAASSVQGFEKRYERFGGDTVPLSIARRWEELFKNPNPLQAEGKLTKWKLKCDGHRPPLQD
jgi:hypothetical protein